MTKEELIKTVEELLQDHDPMELCGWFYDLYEKDKIEFTDFEFLVSLCGFNLTDEFKNATDEERKAMMAEDENDETETFDLLADDEDDYLVASDNELQSVQKDIEIETESEGSNEGE